MSIIIIAINSSGGGGGGVVLLVVVIALFLHLIIKIIMILNKYTKSNHSTTHLMLYPQNINMCPVSIPIIPTVM